MITTFLITKFLQAATERGIAECVMTRYDVDTIVEITNADHGIDSIEQITVIEIVKPVAEAAGDRWAQDQAEHEKDSNYVTVLTLFDNPLDGLARACLHLAEPIAFILNDWLPGTRGYREPADEFNFPLEEELKIIMGGHAVAKDVILIEGLSLYERGCSQPIEGWKFSPYHERSSDEQSSHDRSSQEQSSEFLERMFGATHIIERDRSGAGSALLVPKSLLPNGVVPKSGVSESVVQKGTDTNAVVAPISKWDDEKTFNEESAPEGAPVIGMQPVTETSTVASST